MLAQLKDHSHNEVVEGMLVKWKETHEDALIRSSDVKRAVTREYKRRKQSEATNRQLKALLNRVRKAFESSLVSWDKILSNKNIALVHDPPQLRTSVQHSELENFSEAMVSLSTRIDRLVLDTDLHFKRAGLTDSNSLEFRTRRVFNQSLGDTYEVIVSSMLPCSKEQGSSLFLRILKGSATRVQFTHKDNSFVTECNKLLKSVRFGLQQFELEGVAGIRKVVEPLSNSVVWTTLAALPSEGVNFREDCIMALQDTSKSLSASHLRIWFRVYAEPFSPPSPNSQVDLASERLKDSVLRTHCRTATEFFQSVEKMLANEEYIPHPCNSGG